MGIRSGREFLASLDDGREIWIDGARVKDVASDPRFAGAAASLAELYEMQADPALAEQLTYESPSSGQRVGLSFIEPRSVDDLVRRRAMVKIWMDATCGMFGRSPDFLNIFVTALAMAEQEFGKQGKAFQENVRNYYSFVREADLTLTHTLVNPQVDRSKPVEAQAKDVAARIVKETDASVVITGARMVSTLCAFANELMVMPSTYLNNTEEAKPYAIGFCVPVATPGLRFVCRPTLVPQNAASPMDYPLSHRLDEGDGMVIFDNVEVPWERMFIHRDVALCNGLYNRTGAMSQIMHQFSTKNLSKAEFMMGLGFALADATRIDAHLHVQNLLAELINITEFVRACLRASEADATTDAQGRVWPAAMPLWTVRQMFPQMYVRMCEILQILGAGGLVSVPSYAELDGPIGEKVARYFEAANADARTRTKLFRLAFDAAVSSFAGRQQLYERYYSGDPVRLAGVLYQLYGKKPYIERISTLLDDLEARALPGTKGPLFRPRYSGAE